MAALNGQGNGPTAGPWLVRGEAGKRTSAEVQMLGDEPATEDRPGGWPYFIRQDRPDTPTGSIVHVAIGIQRLTDATLLAAAPDLAEALLRLLTAPDLLVHDLDPATRQAVVTAWNVLVRAAPYLEI